jgi:hypothetical protein
MDSSPKIRAITKVPLFGQVLLFPVAALSGSGTRCSVARSKVYIQKLFLSVTLRLR